MLAHSRKRRATEETMAQTHLGGGLVTDDHSFEVENLSGSEFMKTAPKHPQSRRGHSILKDVQQSKAVAQGTGTCLGAMIYVLTSAERLFGIGPDRD